LDHDTKRIDNINESNNESSINFKISTIPLKFEQNSAKIYKLIDDDSDKSAFMTSNRNLFEKKLDTYFVPIEITKTDD
jgi:hypothetical protein